MKKGDDIKADSLEERDACLDFIKGVCIVLVVLCHSEVFDDLPDIFRILNEAFFLRGFFMVSGWIAYSKFEGRKTQSTGITRKFKRLIIPYISFSVLAIVWHIIICVYFKNTYVSDNYIGWDVIFRDLFCFFSGLGIGTLWFLPILFVSYVVVLFIIRHGPRHMMYGMLIIFLAISLRVSDINVEPISLTAKIISEYLNTIYRLFDGITYTLLGWIIHYKWGFIWSNRRLFVLASVVVSVLTAVLYVPRYLVIVLCTGLFILLRSFASVTCIKKLHIVYWLGRNSLAIMIMHYIFLLPVERVFFSGWMLFGVNFFTSILLVFELKNKVWFEMMLGNI